MSKFKQFLTLCAYVSVVLIAFCLMFQLIFTGNSSFVNAIRIAGEVIAYIVTACYAFYFIKGKKSPVWAIIYAIAVTAIIILLIFR